MMDTQKIHITKFSGRVHVDPWKVFVTSTDRKCATFQLHLQVPAVSWFQRLEDTVNHHWNNFRFFKFYFPTITTLLTTLLTTVTLKSFTCYNCSPNKVLRTFMKLLSDLDPDWKLQSETLCIDSLQVYLTGWHFLYEQDLAQALESAVWYSMWLSRTRLYSDAATLHSPSLTTSSSRRPSSLFENINI